MLNVIGAMISTEVAKTISHGMFNDALIEAAPAMVFAGLADAILSLRAGSPARYPAPPLLSADDGARPRGRRVLDGPAVTGPAAIA